MLRLLLGHQSLTVGFLWSNFQLYVLLSHYLYFISFLDFDLYVLGYDASIS